MASGYIKAQMKAALARFNLPLSLKVNRRGVRMKIPLGASGVGLNDSLRHLMWDGSWKANVFDRLVEKGRPVFVDIGANTGQTLLEIFATHPDARYIGFEPIPSCASYLSSLIQANGWEAATIIASALAADDGLLPLHRNSGSVIDSSATVHAGLRPARKVDTDWVPCLRFDAVREKLKLNQIDFVKIDVEGGELDVVKGMQDTLSSIRPTILCEVLFTDPAADLLATTQRNEELMRRLKMNGYSVWQLIKSENLKEVRSARPILEFPRHYWTAANSELCDYLFIPEERGQNFAW